MEHMHKELLENRLLEVDDLDEVRRRLPRASAEFIKQWLQRNLDIKLQNYPGYSENTDEIVIFFYNRIFTDINDAVKIAKAWDVAQKEFVVFTKKNFEDKLRYLAIKVNAELEEQVINPKVYLVVGNLREDEGCEYLGGKILGRFTKIWMDKSNERYGVAYTKMRING